MNIFERTQLNHTPKKQQETELPSYLSMYEIPGQEKITEHSFNRYQKDKEQDSLIEKQVENSPIYFKNKIKNAPIEEIGFLIKQGLENPNIEVKKVSAEMIWGNSAGKDITFLTNLVLDEIKQGLENPNIEIQKDFSELIWEVSETNRIPLKDIVLTKIKLGLENPDIKVQKIAIEMIKCAPPEEITFLIKQGLENSNNIEIQKIFIKMIRWAPLKERASLVKQGLENPNIEVQKVSIRMIYSSLSEREEINSLIKQGLENPNIEVQKVVVETIDQLAQVYSYIPSVRTTALEKIKQGLENPNIEVQKSIIGLISSAPDKEQYSLIKQGLENPNIEIQKTVVPLIRCVKDTKEKQLLFNLIVKNGLGEELIKTPLYKNKNIDDKNFSRQEFEKTGSGTTLIGGELKDKTIIRHIEPDAFLAWQKTYEDYNTWKKAGFDYVPIEPIQSYKLNKNGLVDVYSGILDLNLAVWRSRSSLFVDELEKQVDKITNVLKKSKIEHLQEHYRNFCLRFFRDKEGRPDFKRAPRLYLIDFDMAVSLEK